VLLDTDLNPHLSDSGLASYIPNANQVTLVFWYLMVFGKGSLLCFCCYFYHFYRFNYSFSLFSFEVFVYLKL